MDFNKKNKNIQAIEKGQKKIYLLATSEIVTFLGKVKDHETSLILTKEKVEELSTFLNSKSKTLDILVVLLKEKTIHSNRLKQLQEVKALVYNLKEIDSTAVKALNFLNEKFVLLLNELKGIEKFLLKAKDSMDKGSSNDEYFSWSKVSLNELFYEEAKKWEDELDYYRTRFLFQKEQEMDKKLKDGFMNGDTNLVENTLATQTIIPKSEKVQRDFLSIFLPKKVGEELQQLIEKYNHHVLLCNGQNEIELIDKTSIEINSLLKNQEKINFDIGKEIYDLKKEQGILSLKSYEAIFSIRQKLINISGVLGERNLLRRGLSDILVYIQQSSIDMEKKHSIIKEQINYLLKVANDNIKKMS